MTWWTVVEYLCHKWPHIWPVCRNYFPVISSFMLYHRARNKNNTMDGTYRADISYHSTALIPPRVLHVSLWFVLFIFSLRFGFVLWCILRFSCKKCSVRHLMLFILIFVYWCTTRFRCQMIFVPFKINTVHPLFLVGFVLPDL